MPAILTDNFDDNSIDAAKWDLGSIDNNNPLVTVAETGGQLVVTPLAATAGLNFNGLVSDAVFNMSQGFVIWKVPQIAGPAANVQIRLAVMLDAANWAGFVIENTTIYFRHRAGGSNTDGNATYNSTNHRYLMLHQCGGYFNWYRSADAITWTSVRTNVDRVFAVTALKMVQEAGTIASVAVPGNPAIFDDVEIGTLDFGAPFEQITAFLEGSILELVLDPGFPMNLIPADATTPFGIPMGRRRSARVTDTAAPIFRWRMEGPGDNADILIKSFDLWLPANLSGATTAIFNVEVDGVPIWAGGSRPSIAPGNSHVRKSNVDFAGVFGEIVEVYVEQLPAGGLDAPIDVLMWAEIA